MTFRPLSSGWLLIELPAFQYKGLDVSALNLSRRAVAEVTVMSIKEKYLIFDRGGTIYVVELGHGFKIPVSIHTPIWCVMDCLVYWDVEVEILRLILGLVQNDGGHKAFPTRPGKDRKCAPEWCLLSSFHLPHLFTLKNL